MAFENINKQISPAAVIFDVDGTPVTLTPSMGGVTFAATTEKVDVKQDGHGDTPVDQITKGTTCTVTLNLSDMTSARMQQIHGVTLSTNQHIFKNDVGASLRTVAKKVQIKPIVNGTVSTTESEWITIYKCSPPIPQFELGFDDENQRVWACEMVGYPDDATGQERYMFTVGENA